MAVFVDNTQEVAINELLRNYEQNRDGWLNSQNLSSKKKKELDLGLDMVYNELKQGTLTTRNEVRDFITTGNPELSWARQTALGYLSDLLDVRPQTKPKELDKYSNTDLKKQFANAGWASNNEINLNNWEAHDYDESTQQFTGTTKRFKQMADFLSTYKDNIKDQQYNFEGSRYTDMKDLTDRLDNAITILNKDSDEKGNPISSEVKMDSVRQALNAIGWGDNDINNLFRMAIPQEPVKEENEDDPLTQRQDEFNKMLAQYQLESNIQKLQGLLDNLNNQQTSESSEDLFNREWHEKIRIPSQQLPEDRELAITNTESSGVPLAQPSIPLADYSPWTQGTNVSPEQLSKLSADLQIRLSKIKASDNLNSQDIKDLKLIYEKIKGTNSEGMLKTVAEGSNEVYLDGFVFWDKGIYYSYDPTTKKLWRRKIVNNLNIYKDRMKQYVSNQNEKKKYAGFYGPSTNKHGGVLKYQEGNVIVYDFTPKSKQIQQENKKSSKPKQQNYDWESAALTDFSNWTWRDWSVLGQILLDAGAIPASYAGPYGPLIGGGMGLLSTAAGAVNDFTDGNITWQDWKNLGVGIGADLVGLVPAWGDAATVGKVLNGITKSAAITQLVSSIPAGAQILDKHKRGEEITVQDMQFLANLFSGAAASAAGHRRNKDINTLNDINKLESNTDLNFFQKGWDKITDHSLSNPKGPREYDIQFNDKNGFFTKWMRQLWQGSGPMSKNKQDTNTYYNTKTGKKVDANGVVIPEETKVKSAAEQPKITEQPAIEQSTEVQEIITPSPKHNNLSLSAQEMEDLMATGLSQEDIKAAVSGGLTYDEIMSARKSVKKDYTPKKLKGGTLEQLKFLRKDGILKCQSGEKITNQQALEQFTKNDWDFFTRLLRDKGYTWDGSKFTKNGNALTDSSGVITKDNYTSSDLYKQLLEQMLRLEGVQEKPGNVTYQDKTNLLESARLLNTLEFNANQEQLGIDSIRDNIVLPQAQEYYGTKLSNGLMDTLGHDQAVSNVTNTINNYTSTDSSQDKAFKLAGLSQINDLITQKNQILAYNVNASTNALIQQEKENQANRLAAANERATILASADKAIDDISMASGFKNFNAVDNSIQNSIKKQTEIDSMHNRLTLQSQLDQLNNSMQQELSTLGENATEAQRMAIIDRYTNKSNQIVNAFYGVGNTLEQPFTPQWSVLKKGGKLDRQMEKRYLAQLKNSDKQIDRLSKVTYKAILKSLGLE